MKFWINSFSVGQEMFFEKLVYRITDFSRDGSFKLSLALWQTGELGSHMQL